MYLSMLKRVFLIFSLASLLSITGCKDRNAASGSAAVQSAAGVKKILQFGNGGEPQFLDPQLATGVPEHGLLRALFEGLVNEPPESENPLPGVAERWEVSADNLTYTFHLRGDAKWSDGAPLTSQDFIRSYQRMLTPTLAADYVYMLFVVKGAEDFFHGKVSDFKTTGFQAPDDHTLVLTLRQPAPFLLHALTHEAWYPVPVHVIAKLGPVGQRNVDWTRPAHFVGNGPFRMKEWLPNQKLVVERSPTYWDREHVKLDEIHFHAVELADTEERMFRAGQLHITNQVPVSKLATYRRDFPAALKIDPWCGTYFYRFNTQFKPLDDVRVRRALSLAVERERLVENVTMGGEIPAYALVPPHTAGYTSDVRLKGDREEAKRLLAEAGYPGGRGFPRLEILYNNLEKHQITAEAIQEMWRRNLGIEVGLHNEEWKVYLADQKSVNFSIQRAGWLADYVDPHVFFDLWASYSDNNNTHWANPEYDRLLSIALDATNNNDRYAVYRKLEQIIVNELPILPLYYYTSARLVSPKVRGYRITLLDSYPWKDVDLAP